MNINEDTTRADYSCRSRGATSRGLEMANSQRQTAFSLLDECDLLTDLQKRVLTIQGVPNFLSCTVRSAFAMALGKMRSNFPDADDIIDLTREWKLLILISRMRKICQSQVPRDELLRRAFLFQ